MNPQPSSRRTPWHESLIVRIAAFAAAVLLLGNAATAVMILQSFKFIRTYVHSDEIEDGLKAHVERVKEVQSLRQALILERFAAKQAAMGQNPGQQVLTAATVRSLAIGASVGLGIDGDRIEVTTKGTATPAGEATTWLDRDRLAVGNWIVEFPRGSTFDAFQSAQRVLRLYQVGLTEVLDFFMHRFLVHTSLVLLGTFLILVTSLAIAARRFHRRLGEVIQGFADWSEKDQNFRFRSGYRGELKLITGQFNAMADEVEANRQKNLYLEKVASWQIIARKLAHEIKNPLTPIQMMVSQLRRRYRGGDPDFGKLLDDAQTIITEEVTRLRRMVDNFSNFARLPEPQPKVTDLTLLASHVVELQRAAFPHHSLGCEAGRPGITAVVDEDLIRQVLINLIKNAAEASEDAPAAIMVRVAETATDCLIHVQDHGPGIPAENLPRIFEAYFTTKHTGPTPGMGLGLAVCQKIVLDHGGQLQVSSRPGNTVFTIRLPRRPEHQGPHPPSRQES